MNPELAGLKRGSLTLVITGRCLDLQDGELVEVTEVQLDVDRHVRNRGERLRGPWRDGAADLLSARAQLRHVAQLLRRPDIDPRLGAVHDAISIRPNGGHGTGGGAFSGRGGGKGGV